MKTRGFHAAMALLALSSLLAWSSYGGDSVGIDVFKGPTPKSRFTIYPNIELAQGHEGWVEMQMMVDPSGKPYEISVTDSSGNEMFERAALHAAKDWTFDPAMLGNQPVDAGFTYRLTFVLGGDSMNGASTPFISAYKRVLKAIEAGDQAGAEAGLASLQVNNLYEDAYNNVVRYHYHRQWGTEAQQLIDLRRVVTGAVYSRYLPPDMFLEAVRSLLTLQLRAKDFASALKTWQTLQKSAPKDELDKLKLVMAKVEALRTAETSYSVDGGIENGTSWFYALFKNRFQIAVASGKVAEIKLRCDKKYVFFRYEPDVQYRISDRYGECWLELVGEHGTRFSLVQS